MLQSLRRTVGIDVNGDQFVTVDDWTSAADAHRVRELPWTGVTTFIAKEKVEGEEQYVRKEDRVVKEKDVDRKKVRWSDEEEEENSSKTHGGARE